MKLVLAIVSNDDRSVLSTELIRAGFQVTKLATTGGFLKSGNTTFIMGVDDEKVEKVIEIIKQYSSKRTEMVPSPSVDTGMYAPLPVEINVGGATVFVLNIEQFKKL